MNLGFFGGTFDPIHKGHIEILKAAAKSGFLDKILVVPSAVPPKKSIMNVSFASYRYEMVEMTLRDLKFDIPVSVSDIEINRKSRSYTVDTVKQLKKENKDVDVYIICGSDILYEIDGWHKPEELLSSTGLFVAERPGSDPKVTKNHIDDLKENYKTNILYFRSPVVDISSSELRGNYARGKGDTIENILPELNKWIIENALYDPKYDLSQLLSNSQQKKLMDLERDLRKYISGTRLIHSLNTMRECVYLAKINNADPFTSAIAGLLHDNAKNNKTQEMKDLSDDVRHSYLGSMLSAERFGILDKEILEAIKYHTTFHPDAGILTKILYVADKIEPSRKFRRIDDIRKIAYADLDKGCYECMKDIITQLKRSKKKIHNDTLEAYEIYRKKYE